MAGDWIKMRTDLFTHPKVVRISSALKADTLRTVGGLMSVWCLFDAHSADGILEGYRVETLDDHLRWPGFAAAMMAVRWLSDDGESLVLPEFDTHNGQSAKRRAQDADRKREVRKLSAPEADKTRTREEKRREESSKKEAKATVRPTATRFEEFWESYPNKKSKKDAERHWKREGCDSVADQIIGHVQLMLSSDDGWRRGYVPMGSTYVNGRRWEDRPTGPPQAHANGPSKTMQAIMNLEAMKSNGLAETRNHNGFAEAAFSVTGPDPGHGRIAWDGCDMAGDFDLEPDMG